jgi:hypothetical protein
LKALNADFRPTRKCVQPHELKRMEHSANCKWSAET